MNIGKTINKCPLFNVVKLLRQSTGTDLPLGGHINSLPYVGLKIVSLEMN